MTSIRQATENQDGFLIFHLGELYDDLLNGFLAHSSKKMGEKVSALCQFNRWVNLPSNFERIKPKSARLLPADIVDPLAEKIINSLPFKIPKSAFISDEEKLGFPNIYWRCVRSNAASDVWGLHADRWFWEIGEASLATKWRRVKIWLPLQQPKNESGLWILPGSHKKHYNYDVIKGTDGKLRPRLTDEITHPPLVPAEVKVGQAIVFNDNLLHSGISLSSLRLSAEFTIALNRRSVGGQNPVLSEPT
ncbi:phytanoyl-CoA dioxygenase family protein [Luminiphilus sp.]|nr:phytanoyl-CoA dioxygenase family protein [Luminiphilus sp.]